MKVCLVEVSRVALKEAMVAWDSGGETLAL
jgi:hypothetical protein